MILNTLVGLWLFITVIFYILVLVTTCMVAHYYKDKDKEEDKKKKKKKDKNKYKNYIDIMFISREDYSVRNIYYTFDNVWFGESLFAVIWVGIFISTILYVLQYKFKMFNFQLDTNSITDVVLGLSGIVIGVVCVIITLVKKYYLFFSVWDVFQFYKIPQYTTVLVITMIGDIVINVLGLNSSNIIIYSSILTFTILNIGCGIIVLYKIRKILFGEKIELSLLKELYKVFWYNQIDLTNLGDEEYWNEDTIYINLEYLMRCLLNNKINTVKSIEFVSTLDVIKQKCYKIVRIVLLLNNVLLIILLYYRHILNMEIKIYTCILIVFTVFIVVGPETLKLAIIIMLKGKCGYALKIDEGNYVIVPRVGIIFNRKFKHYIEYMNSICALFYIWIRRNKKNNISMCKTEFIKFINRLDENKNSLSYEYLPVFTIGFFLWDSGLNVEEVKCEYNKFVYAIKDDMFNDQERTKFFDFIIPIIPIINSTNSGEKLLEKLKFEKKEDGTEKSTIYDISSKYINLISPFIEDMRLLTNICNEFSIYKQTLNSIKLRDEAMFSMMVFKSLYPREFSKAEAEKGVIKQSFEDKIKFVETKKNELDDDKERFVKILQNIEKDVLENEQEVKAALIHYLEGNNGQFNYGYNKELLEKLRKLNYISSYGIDEYYEEDQKLHERVKKTRFEVWVKKNIA